MVCRRSQRLSLNTFIFIGVSWRKACVGANAMNKEIISQTESDEEILTFDIPDVVLERAGSAEQKAFTMFYCTHQSSECGLR